MSVKFDEKIAEAMFHLIDECDPMPTYKAAKLAFENAYSSVIMARTDGNISAAARIAGKDRRDCYDLLERAGVDADWYRGNKD